jgi:hypothetical protein
MRVSTYPQVIIRVEITVIIAGLPTVVFDSACLSCRFQCHQVNKGGKIISKFKKYEIHTAR